MSLAVEAPPPPPATGIGFYDALAAKSHVITKGPRKQVGPPPQPLPQPLPPPLPPPPPPPFALEHRRPLPHYCLPTGLPPQRFQLLIMGFIMIAGIMVGAQTYKVGSPLPPLFVSTRATPPQLSRFVGLPTNQPPRPPPPPFPLDARSRANGSMLLISCCWVCSPSRCSSRWWPRGA